MLSLGVGACCGYVKSIMVIQEYNNMLQQLKGKNYVDYQKVKELQQSYYQTKEQMNEQRKEGETNAKRSHHEEIEKKTNNKETKDMHTNTHIHKE